MPSTAVPEQGQLAEVRQRQYVVTEVRRGALPDAQQPQHLVSLSSVEDDALGETLRVVWELEPGARVFEKSELPSPSGFDDPSYLDAFLDAVKWGSVSSADVQHVQSPFRSGIDIEDYQLDPVVRAIQMHRVNLLIADDVGLGKTIEAGLVIQELIFRHRARKVLIICPSSLQVQWQEQMRDKFGLEFRIIDSDTMKDLRRRRGLHVNPWAHFPRLITSMDYIKRDRPFRLFCELLPAEGESVYPRRFDLMIVDEAHNVAPSGSGLYAIDSHRTETIRELAPHFEHKLFLTATPHNGYKESFTALLELLDSQRFARGVEPDRRQLETIMVRRLKSELPPLWDGTPRFPERRLEAISVDYTEEENAAYDALKRYTELSRERAGTRLERFSVEFVLKLLKKRLVSSPQAFAITLGQHLSTLTSYEEKRRRVDEADYRLFRTRIEAREEEESSDDDKTEEARADIVSSTSEQLARLDAEQQKLLEEMRKWAERASARPDSKALKLIEWVESIVRPGGKWAEDRVIIFTEYRATQKWLYQLLAAEGLTSGDRLMTLFGGMPGDDRERVKAAFQARPDESAVRILLATDAASEGLDLQNHCNRLLHYEIPWNPNRLEQRNGRIDRHGQRSKQVFVYHFVGKEYAAAPGSLDGDLEFLLRVALKVNAIREDLGKTGRVIADQVERAMLGEAIRLDTTEAERAQKSVRRVLSFERKVADQISKLREHLNDTRESLRLTPENIEAVVQIGLRLADQPPLIPASVRGIGEHCFVVPALQGSWAACTEGLLHPHTKKRRPIVFDPDLARARDDVVLVHLNHRLVRMCLGLLRAQVWASESTGKLHRVTARLVPSGALESPALIAHGRLVVLGADYQRLHEEVIHAGGVLREGKFVRMNVTQVAEALDAELEEAPSKEMKQHLAGLWPRHSAALVQALEARAKERTRGLEKKLEERARKEMSDVTAVLEELRRNIERELEVPEDDAQLKLFSEEETEQRHRDIQTLHHRLRQIPYEIDRETELIRSRFAGPTPRLFPLAVTWLVPIKFGHFPGSGGA